ncbi:MAG: hypothetical protein HYV54_00635 [Parcubacteria group bacterium]|nr:hypothetical protein [Parcubacteria group bacterium]
MKKDVYILILTAVLLAPVYVFSQNSALEQVSPEDLRRLEEVVKQLEETPSQTQAVSAGNDFNLDLIWKTNTLVPYDYPGKALPTVMSGVTIYALADVPKPQNLTYSWIVDDASSNREGPDQVGRGKYSFLLVTYQIPKFTHELRVTATDETTGRSASAGLEIKTVLPEVYLYAQNNNIFSNLASSVINFLAGAESGLMARAFYFNTRGLNDLDFKWFFNNKEEENTGARPEILPVTVSERSPAGSQANLKLEIQPKSKRANIHERAAARTTINIIKNNQ